MAEPSGDHPLRFHIQYIKDLSFENPNAPKIYGLLLKNQPEISVSVDVRSEPLEGRNFEVTLILRVGATIAGQSAFLVDLQYAVVIEVTAEAAEAAEADIERLLLTEGPRFIFPFARATVADMTREGGFPPLVINPIDFERFYAHKREAAKQAQEQAQEQAPEQTPEQTPPEPQSEPAEDKAPLPN